MNFKTIITVVICIPMLTGCLKGLIPDPEADAKKIEDEAAATGGGCRQAGRSLEQCYLRNEGLNRNGAMRGWREMDEYMRSNKLEPQPPTKDEIEKEIALKDASKDQGKTGGEPLEKSPEVTASEPVTAEQKKE